MEKVLDEVVALERAARGAAADLGSVSAFRLDWRQAAVTWQYQVKKDEEAEVGHTRHVALTALCAVKATWPSSILRQGFSVSAPKPRRSLQYINKNYQKRNHLN